MSEPIVDITKNSVRCGIVTTFQLPQHNINLSNEVLESFILHHLSIGFERIYLFYDGDSNPFTLPAYCKFYPHACVTIIPRSSALNSSLTNCASFEQLKGSMETCVATRQTLNAEYAAKLARNENINWLLHIDMDELFYLENGTAPEHFAYLENLGLEHFTYINYEGIPEEWNCGNYFKSISLFKVNHHELPLEPAVASSMDFFRKRNEHDHYFLCYDNGKSAVKIGKTEIQAKSVHEWKGNQNSVLRSGTNFVDYRSNEMKQVVSLQFSCILHYTNCGMEWIKFKYETLGDFKTYWIGDKGKIPPCFHLDCRNSWLNKAETGLEEIYKNQVLLDKSFAMVKQNFEHAGILRRIRLQTLHPHKTKGAIQFEKPTTTSVKENSSMGQVEKSKKIVTNMDKSWVIAGISKEWL